MTSSATARFVTHRPVAVLMVFLAAVVFGWLSYGRLPLALMPELTYPTLTVRTEYPGAAPEEVENDISRPIEEAVGVIGGLRKLSSVSRAGVSDVVLEFAWDTEMSDATQDVLEKLDLAFLPEEATRPLILHYDPSLDPMLELSLSGVGDRFEGESGLRRLRRLAELQIKKELEPIKGVAAVRVRGGLEEEIHVLLHEGELRRTGIAIGDVIDRLAQENINLAGGTLQEGRTEYIVRTINEYTDLDQISETVVTTFGDRPVRIKDIGSVERTHREREIVTRSNGRASVQIEIFKEGDANIVALAQRVRAALGEGEVEKGVRPQSSSDEGPHGLAARLWRDEGAKLELVADRSTFIESSITEVRNTALMGGLLAVFVLYLLLRSYRSTAIIAISIPMSLLITFAPLHLSGVSLNIMSLGGLALGVGMLVDSSIVVLESIFRCREEGDGDVESAARGVAEVQSAVWASTLTTVAVFFPMVFVEGVAGQAFGDLGLAVVISLLASTVVALWFIPMLASRGGIKLPSDDPAAESRRWHAFLGESWRASSAPLVAARRRGGVLGALLLIPAGIWLVLRLIVCWSFGLIGAVIVGAVVALGALFARIVVPVGRFLLEILLWLPGKVADATMKAIQGIYPRLLRHAVSKPGWVALGVVVALWMTLQIGRSLDSELLPEVHQGEFTIEMRLPVGTPLARTEAIVAPIERAILDDREQIRALLVTVGYDSTTSQRSDEGEHTARFKVLLEEGKRNAAVESAVIGRLRQRFSGIPDLESRVTRPVLFSAKTPIEIEIHGQDLVRLREQADRATEVVASIAGLADVESTLQRGAPEVQVVYDRERMSILGLDVGSVARLVRDKVRGHEATRYNLHDRRLPIVVRLAEEDRQSVEDVRGMVINPGTDRPIRLADVAEVRLGEGPSEVRRIDGRRVAVIGANLAEGSLSEASWRIASDLRERVEWPREMTYLVSGQSEEWDASRRSLWIALALSIFLVYVIMAAQFESLLQPLVIMVTIPLAFSGTVFTLAALGIHLSIVVFLGMILLAGVVVNNAIVLIDYVNQLRDRGLDRDQAILTAGKVRLRPILMTTATTVLGLLPMALGFGDGAEIRTPMAITVISGLTVSTLLTLIVIPAIYAFVDGLRERLLGPRKQVEIRGAAGLAAAGSSASPS